MGPITQTQGGAQNMRILTRRQRRETLTSGMPFRFAPYGSLRFVTGRNAAAAMLVLKEAILLSERPQRFAMYSSLNGVDANWMGRNNDRANLVEDPPPINPSPRSGSTRRNLRGNCGCDGKGPMMGTPRVTCSISPDSDLDLAVSGISQFVKVANRSSGRRNEHVSQHGQLKPTNAQ